MLKESLRWLSFSEDLETEAVQCQDEGKDIRGLAERVESLSKDSGPEPDREALAGRLLDDFAAAPLAPGSRYTEPDELEQIRALRGWTSSLPPPRFLSDDDWVFDRIYGAWLGRCGGCLAGVPVETWTRKRIQGFARAVGNEPMTHYFSSAVPPEIRDAFGIEDSPGYYGAPLKSWINNVRHAPEDDDTNYTVLALKVLETQGQNFTSEDVAETWLTHLPILHTCTAERVAYRNLVSGLKPPQSALHRNPYREWIGAQIRGDLFGYVTPGNPELGAELAWRDARVSHVKNGIYGEMWVAAMLSVAFQVQDPQAIILGGLGQIPNQCRLSQRIREVLVWKESAVPWKEAVDRIHALYDETCPHDWCHTISNAMVVCTSLLYGGADYGQTVSMAVLSGFDTDCNAATAGSIVGLSLGAKSLPASWLEPLNDTLQSGVDGMGLERISTLARRTVSVMRTMKS